MFIFADGYYKNYQITKIVVKQNENKYNDEKLINKWHYEMMLYSRIV